MRMRPSSALVSLILALLSACASAQEPGGAATATEPTSDVAPPDSGPATATAGKPETPSAPTTTPSSTTAATAAPTATAATPPGPAKEANALIIEPVFTAKGGGKVAPETTAELLKAFNVRLAASSKMAGVGAAGVSTARHVVGTFMIEAPVTDEKGLTVRMGFTGIESVGKCPVFDLDQRLTMSGGKNTAADVLELQRAAVAALLEKLEQTASTLKPKANCTASKPK